MADKNQSQQNSDSIFSKAATAALAIGAGAAALYRAGLMPKVARTFDRYYDFAASAKKAWLPKKDFGEVTITDVRKSFQDAKIFFRQLKADYNSKPVRIDTNSNTSLFSVLQAKKTFDTLPGRITEKVWRRDNLIQEAHKFLNATYQNAPQNSREKWNKFIEKVSHNMDNLQHVHDSMKFIDFTSDEKNVAMQVLNVMQTKKLAQTQADKSALKKNTKNKVATAFDKFMEIDNLEKTFGTSRSGTKFIQKLLGDQAATVRDILKKADEGKVIINPMPVGKNGRPTTDDSIEVLRETYKKIKAKDKNEAERFLDLYVDRQKLRKNAAGEIYSFNNARRLTYDVLNTFSDTIPGTILKVRAFLYKAKAPTFHFIERGTLDPVFASRTGSQNHQVQDHYVRLMNRFYKLDANGVEQVFGLEDLNFVSGTNTATARLIRQMSGDADFAPQENKFLRYFDMFQDREIYGGGNFVDKFLDIFRKTANPEWRGNVFKRMLKPTDEERYAFDTALVNQDINYTLDYISKAERVNKFWERNTYELSDSAINFLSQKTSGKTHELLAILQESDDRKLLQSFLDYSEKNVTISAGYHNSNLQNILQRYISNPVETLNMIQQKNDRTHLNISSQLKDLFNTKVGNETVEFYDILRTEIAKESFLQYAQDMSPSLAQGKNYKAVLDLVEGMEVGTEKIQAERLARLAILQEKTGINFVKNPTATEQDLMAIMSQFEDVMNLSQNNAEDKAIRESFNEMIHEGLSDFESFGELYQEKEGVGQYNTWIALGKTTTPLDILRNLNEYTKAKAYTKRFFKQFNAGADNPEDLTTISLIPYFSLSRLSDDLNKAGLGFSRESMQSTFDIAKNIMLKRAIPAALFANYFEYLDDTSQDLTGTSITGAFAKGVMNVDLAMRRTFDALGITEWLKEEKQINPIFQYWGDKNDFMDYDERRKWYESGYDPVRKGAWWIFGSVNEARGGEIQYWQPSFVRRINSDYEDISLYGGNSEKWAHSWLPTPTHPLSPLFELWNPYWLEEMHEDDRPYAISGSLFADGTPWGAILNPTIGQIIKPREELHDFRLNNGVDIKNLLREMNEYIKAKARDFTDNNLISLNGADLAAQNFTAWNAPSEDSVVDTFQTGINGYDDRNVLQSSSGYGGSGIATDFYVNKSRHGIFGIYQPSPMTYSEGFNALDEENIKYLYDNDRFSPAINFIKSAFDIGEDTLNPMPLTVKIHDEDVIADQDGKYGVFRVANNDYEAIKEAKDLLRDMNEAIKKKPQKIARVNEFDKEEGIISPEKLKDYRPSKGMELLNHSDEIADLVNQGDAYDFVHNAAISARLITGIYGYMLGATTGIGVDNQKMVPTSQDMTSFSRSFWDTNIGGAGGDIMEIFRRFIPDYRRGNRVSPLLNEMPDWLPERFKFGDAFVSIPKGEARLPGAGYESLNELHPDIFGTYGSFDRFKILADVAPFSAEYKVWKKIAKKTVTDPELIEEMKEIQERVTQQGKKHDFYEYQFKDKGLKYDRVVISEILDNGKFKSGDDKIFKLAGVRVKGNNFETATEVLNRYLHVGEEVTVAIDDREGYQRNKDKKQSINAAVFVDGENISNLMLENGDAVKRKGDTSTAALLTSYTPVQKFIGHASEVFAHLDVPWLSDQFLRVRSPLEAYKADEIYGTPYQSWEHPIDSFLKPAIERAIYENHGILGTASYHAYNIATKIRGLDAMDKNLLATSYLLFNRGAFIGAAVSNFVFPLKAKKAMTAAKNSGNLIDIAHIWQGGHSYFMQSINSAYIGSEVARFFEKSKTRGAIVGAVVGDLIRSVRGGANFDYLPDRAVRKWQMQEYFDRLTHLKYMGLYKAAAEKAKDEEGIDVEEELEKRDWLDRRKEELHDKLEALNKTINNKMRDSEFKQKILSAINARMDALKDRNVITHGGKYTHSALLYKQAAEQTMTGLKQGATWSEIISALPKNDREYFIEFVKERNPEAREEILNMVSPFLRKALLMSWGKKVDEEISDEEYFNNNKIPMPDATWKGWRPDVNLSDIEVKTVENEGMLLSDFGFYESELRKSSVINAPSVHQNTATNISREIKKILSGAGLKDVNVDVTDGMYGAPTKIWTDIKLWWDDRKTERQIRDAVEQNIS